MNETVPVSGVPAPPPAGPAKRAESGKVGASYTIARNSMLLSIDTILSIVALMYCSAAVARDFGPDVTGDYNYILMVAGVLRMVTELAIPATFRKFAAELMGAKDYSTLKGLIRLVFKVQTRVALIGVAIVVTFVVLRASHDRKPILIMAVISVVPALLMTIPAGVLQATENFLPNVIGSLSATITNASGITLSLIFGWGLTGVVAAFLCSRVVDCVVRFVFFRKLYKTLPGELPSGPIDRVLLRRLIRFAGSQMILTGIQIMLWERTEVFFIRHLSQTRQIAFFSLSITVIQQVTRLPAILSEAAGATIMVAHGRNPKEASRIAGTAIWFTMLLAAPMLFGVAALSGPLFRLVYGAQYLVAIPVLTTMALWALTQALQFPMGPFLAATEQQRFVMFWASIMIVVNVGTCFLLVPPLGALGAAWARGLCHLVGVVGFLVFMNRKFGVPVPVLRMAKLLLVCVMMFLAVRAVEQRLPSLLAILCGIPLGVVVFVGLTRFLDILDRADRDRLLQLRRLMPARMRNGYQSLVGLLVRA